MDHIEYLLFYPNLYGIAISVLGWLFCILVILFTGLLRCEWLTVLQHFVAELSSGNFYVRLPASKYLFLESLNYDFNLLARRLDMYEKNTIRQLMLEKAKLENMCTIISDGIVLLDLKFNVMFINPSATRDFKFLNSCVIGLPITDFLPIDVNYYIEPVLLDIKKKLTSSTYKQQNDSRVIRIDTINGYMQKCQITITAIQSDYGISGFGIVLCDITHQVGLDEAKTQFISNVSHELRTPLFNIRSFLETLSEYRDSLTERQKSEFLDIANQETQRLTCLINDVLDLSRLESDVLDELSVIEFHELSSSVLQTSQLRANYEKVSLLFQICDNVTSVNGYPNLIIQVLSNLIGNSLKFTFKDGRIVLKVYIIKACSLTRNNSRHKIRVEIIDEGTGISEIDQNRIFDRFVRLENNVHTFKGTGLGLSIVRHIVQKHQSHINVYSELDIGSSFWFDLPLTD
uniref:Uncharacterized sensor-like histidine kinase ycf26 n=1 Tax=Yamadaella caenomyce TaxID=259029 RepID=A0A1G4NYZ3_9FLOR|nr:Drug sensory protein A [Yamadaella caenomyce]SCW23736.1 Drug sensory protein A [Yamadaella caenomyce]